MTAPVPKNSIPSLSVPPTRTTAPVLEFNCLYTHDIRRKSKRWQDGFLRYHTFNKRVMVYDVSRNYIGDCHWSDEHDVAEGDELTLDDPPVLVEVMEAKGKTETDLTDLRAAVRKTPVRPIAACPDTVRSSTVAPLKARSLPSVAPAKHKSLDALLGVRRGPTGKAVLPINSPFEDRVAQQRAITVSSSPDLQEVSAPQRPAAQHVPKNRKSRLEQSQPLRFAEALLPRPSKTATLPSKPVRPILREPQQPPNITESVPSRPQRKTGTLHIASTSKPKVLLCQSQLKTTTPTKQTDAEGQTPQRAKTQRELLEERRKRVRAREGQSPVKRAEMQQKESGKQTVQCPVQPADAAPARVGDDGSGGDGGGGGGGGGGGCVATAAATATAVPAAPLAQYPAPPAAAPRLALSRPEIVPLPPRRKNTREAVAPRTDPWSREAYDLFEWRPPGWDEEGWCIKPGY